MTYTVKNGTWCKDNNKEYYSTTKTGLKAALAAGEITSGTKVVIHEPQYHAGQLIQSLNPECPEGCFVPHGQAFDTSVYTELAKLFPDGNLPDMRECVMVCAGRSERTEITNHDEYTAGQFKDDQFAEHDHSVSSTVIDPGHDHTVTDPGHDHTVTDPGHGHTVTDPGHDHTITDPGHDHGRGTQEITGHFVIGKTASAIGGAFSRGGAISSQSASDTGGGNIIYFNASSAWSGRSEKVTTGVSINNNTTGISVNDNTTGITIGSHATGITVGSHATGITVNTTEEKAGAADKVTHGKQFGVYYYIAF